MIGFRSSGSFDKTFRFLRHASSNDAYRNLHIYGKRGVEALADATPVDTGETASSWGYRITRSRTQITIEWFNTNVVDGANIAILLQLGHGTGTGGYVKGRDYINPVIQPLFDKMADDIWREVTR